MYILLKAESKFECFCAEGNCYFSDGFHGSGGAHEYSIGQGADKSKDRRWAHERIIDRRGGCPGDWMHRTESPGADEAGPLGFGRGYQQGQARAVGEE